MNKDFLIIGQGLAGSLLAWELMQRGYDILIVDNGQENASQVAAGLINPVTGLRFVKSPEIDFLLPSAKRRYAQLAEFFRQDFYVEKPMLRLFRSAEETKNCLKRLNNPDYQSYLGDVYPQGGNLDPFDTPFGFLAQKQTGYLLTQPLLACLKAFFIAKECYRLADFAYQDIQFKPVLCWKGITPKHIIFCEGHNALRNPWFSWLPFQPVKGEILTLEHHSPLPDNIINYGNWLVPLNNRKIRIGATFEWQHLDTQPTDAGKQGLLAALKQITRAELPVTVINQHANIRPCTLDKQPFIGHHPQHPQLSIFNGFGAKGSLQIPWYSQQFAEALLNNCPLPSNIQRHYATHFTGQGTGQKLV